MRQIKFINSNWLYRAEFKEEYIKGNINDNDFTKIDIPHTNIELPYNYFDEREYQFISCYVKKLNLDSTNKGKKVYVDFEGVMIACDVYLNGNHITSHKGGYTPFSADISDFIKYDEENILVVKVDSTERKDIPPYGNVVDYLTYGGIYREVSLRIVDQTHINNIYTRTYNCLEESKKLEIDVEINNCSNDDKFNVSVQLLDNENVLYSVEKELKINEDMSINTLEISDIKEVELWDLDNPKLYSVKVELRKDNEVIDVYSDRIGFRDAKFTTEGFYLNGKLTKIVGLNRHQSYPYVGYAMPERVQKKDVEILKYDLGLNLVRTSHYPQSRHFLDRCDEVGILVFEEIPGWQHIGDLDWQALAIKDVEDMIKRDYNRPSVILWGVRINESQDNHDFYTRTNKLARELDPVRQTGGVRYIHKSELLEDVFTLNDFAHNGGERVFITQKEATGLDYKVPYLVTESNGHMYPTKSFDHEAKAVEHAHRHLRVINEVLGSEEISGTISWCAFDYNTHSCFGSGDKICYHGVMDMFRNKKYAAYSYASQKDCKDGIVLEAITEACRGERDGGGIIPFSILTNCDYVKIYKDGEYIDEYHPDRNTYKNLEHPPINVYHILSSDLNLPVSDEDKNAIRNFVINKVKTGNLVDLTPEDYNFFGEIAARANITVPMILGVVYKLAGGWGEKENMLTIEGYINGEAVISKTIGELRWRSGIEVIPDDTVLSIDKTSYDATRVVVKIVDSLGNPLKFNNEFVEVEIDGPAKVMGPSKFGLVAGTSAFWIRTIGEVGEVKIKVKGMYFESEAKIDII